MHFKLDHIMKMSLIKISIILSIFLLSSCDSNSLSELTKNEDSFDDESLNLLSYQKTPTLVINGPFTKKDKIKASKILAKILCKNEKSRVKIHENLEIENQFKKEISKISLEKGINDSPQVIKTGRELKEFLIEDCKTLSISKEDEEDIYLKNFRFNK